MLQKKEQNSLGMEKEAAVVEKGRSSVDRTAPKDDTTLGCVHKLFAIHCGSRWKNMMLVFCLRVEGK